MKLYTVRLCLMTISAEKFLNTGDLFAMLQSQNWIVGE